MKTLYDAAALAEVKQRMARLGPESERLWGKMNAAQMLAHCSIAMETAVGERRPPRLVIGRILGPMVRPHFSNDKPYAKNSPTDKSFIVADQRDVALERDRLCSLLDRFASGGPTGCTTHPHSFFGRLNAEEWGKGMYKHLDHHLRQFGL